MSPTNLQPEMLAALRRAAPWLGKMIADGAHKNTVLPNDCVRTLQMVEAVIAKADGTPAPDAEAYERIAGTPETKHTPLPWVFAFGMIYDERGATIALADRTSPFTTPTERDANAAFIVRACNSHYDLVEACDKYLEAKALNDKEGSTVTTIMLLRQAEKDMRAAVSKAKGQQ